MDLMNAGLSLGRWFGIRVVLSWFFLIWADFEVFQAGNAWHYAALSMAVLFGLVLLHEFGHCFACRLVQGHADRILLWPLGGLAYCQPPDRPGPQFITTVGGPLVNVILTPVLWAALIGAKLLPVQGAAYPYLVFAAEWALMYNIILLLFNLIPAYPTDGGRMLQEILWPILGYPRSLIVTGMIGTAAGAAFIVLALGLWHIDIPLPLGLGALPLGALPDADGNLHPNLILGLIGAMCALQSFAIYRQGAQAHSWRRR